MPSKIAFQEVRAATTTEFLVGLGANLPQGASPPRTNLEVALSQIANLEIVERITVSRFYRSAAVPRGSGPDFVNAAAAVRAEASPAAFLAALHGIEATLGRVRPERWAPRVVDLDLLAAGSAVLPDSATVRRWMALPMEEARRMTPETLILPHPRLHQRAFVLLPLADIAPDWHHPLTGMTVREMVEAIAPEARAEVTPLDA